MSVAFGLAASWPEFKVEMDRYPLDAGVDQSLVRFYEDLFKIWYDYRERIPLAPLWDPGAMNESLRKGQFLLHGGPLPVDAAFYREILEQITGALAVRYPEMGDLSKLLALPGLQGDNLDTFLVKSAAFDGEKMLQHLQDQGWDDSAGVEGALIAFLLFAALTPFYLSLAAAAAPAADLSLWRQGFCPLCGQKPGMSKLRSEDGARVLECWLCHIQWQFPRLECPFCANKDIEQLQFFYTDEHPGRRVQLCGCCNSYLKTSVIKEIGREVILELENIFSIQLDLLARREGYLPGEDLALLS
jgi:FdhE protein